MFPETDLRVGWGAMAPPKILKNQRLVCIFTPKFRILPLKFIFWPPYLKILSKLAHEIKTENLSDHSCIPFAQENKNLESILWTIHKTGQQKNL